MTRRWHSHPGEQRQSKTQEISRQQTRQMKDSTHKLASRDKARERLAGSKWNKGWHSHPSKQTQQKRG